MMTTRGAAGRAVVSLAQQVGLSVLGTLAATVVITVLKSEWSIRAAAPVFGIADEAPRQLPSLTRSGKFSERALSGTETQPFVVLTRLPPVLPLFTAPSVPPLTIAAGDGTNGIGRDHDTLLLSASSHSRPRAAAPMPPRRISTASTTMAPLLTSFPAETEEPSMWSRPKAAYRRVADWSGSLLDLLLP